jgi:hypothetical protein
MARCSESGTWLVGLYSLAGFGYIITATFLPVIARQALPGSSWPDLFWPLFGLAVIPGAILGARLPLHWDNRLMLAGAYAMQALGVLLSVAWPTVVGFALGSLLLGLPFTAITLFAVRDARRLRGNAAAGLIGLATASYGVGQILGPLFAAPLAQRTVLFPFRCWQRPVYLQLAQFAGRRAVRQRRGLRARHAPVAVHARSRGASTTSASRCHRPGIDRPLRNERDFERFAGELVDVTLKAPMGAAAAGQVAANRRKFRGTLEKGRRRRLAGGLERRAQPKPGRRSRRRRSLRRCRCWVHAGRAEGSASRTDCGFQGAQARRQRAGDRRVE